MLLGSRSQELGLKEGAFLEDDEFGRVKECGELYTKGCAHEIRSQVMEQDLNLISAE